MQTTGQWDQNSFMKTLVVSIHDVHAATVDVVTDILNDLREKGVHQVSLLIVPNFHGKGKISGHPDFCRWLSQQEAAGHEIVLHGYFHLREPKSEGILQHMMTQTYTAGEGEFYDLKYEDARARLEEGRKMLAMNEIPGFIAPAWLLGPEAERAVKDLGFRYTVRLASATDFQTGKIHTAPTLAYSTRSVWRRKTSLLWNFWLKQFSAVCPLVRISIHPPDWQFPGLRTQILRLTAEALAVRSPMSYYQWVCLSART